MTDKFPSITRQIMDTLEEDPAAPGEGLVFSYAAVERAVREAVSTSEIFLGAGYEAFEAGHKACMEKSVASLFQDPTHVPDIYKLWMGYEPSEQVCHDLASIEPDGEEDERRN